MSAGPPTLRAFLGLRPPPDVARDLAEACARAVPPEYRRMAPADVHVTLHFLGDVARARLPELERALVECLRSVAALELECGRGPEFPGELRPGIVWVGVRDRTVSGALVALRRTTAVALERLGLLREPVEGPRARTWVPHVTLARPGRERSAGGPGEPGAWLRRAWTASEVLLFESGVAPAAGGALPGRYAVVARFPLIPTPA